MNDFSQKFNSILAESYHNALLMEETKRKYSKASFSFRDRNAIAYLLRYPKGRTIGDVAKYLKISRPSATSLIKKLEKHGLIARHADPGNDRNTVVTVTRKGKMFSSYQRQYREEMAQAACEGFSEEEKEVLYKGFCKLNDFFTSSIKASVDKHR
jgi:DNA-binding MarR family transcriptional regulator